MKMYNENLVTKALDISGIEDKVNILDDSLTLDYF